MADINTNFASSEAADVTFELDDGEKVECHRGVLARASPFLKAMFTHDDRPLYKMNYHSQLPQRVKMEDLISADYFLATDLLARCIEANSLQT